MNNAVVQLNTRKWLFLGISGYFLGTSGYFCGFHVVFASTGVVLFFLGDISVGRPKSNFILFMSMTIQIFGSINMFRLV